MTEWMPLLAGVLTAMVGGFYFAFSAVVMPALRRRPSAEASSAMVSVNVQAVRTPFMLLFFGAAIASVGVLIVLLVDPQPESPLRIAGALLSLAGWLSTVVINVPLNTRLEKAEGDRAAAWARFDRPWTRGNHLRTVLSVAGAVALLVPVG